jgi:hypothetical protein
VPTATSTPTPTTEPTPTATPDIPTNEQLIGSGLAISKEKGATGLRVVILQPDGKPWQGQYVRIFEQRTDVSGNPTYGNSITSDSINQQGQANFELKSGTYVACLAGTGYAWTAQGCVYNLQVEPNHTTIARVQAGALEVAVVDAEGQPYQDVYSNIYTQKQDVNGNQITNERVAGGQPDNTGLKSYWLTPGRYAVQMNLRGYNWGNLASDQGALNIVAQAGQTNRILIKMGKLQLGLKQTGGDPAANTSFQVYTQKPDISGKPTLGEDIWNGQTDNGGLASVALTKGKYALRIGENVLYDVPIEWGKITTTDGTNAMVK